jgi:hypothetical protein
MDKIKPIQRICAEDYHRSFSHVLLVLLYAIPILFGFYYITHYAVNVPYWDQWGVVVPWTIEWYEGSFDYSRFFETQNDSRPVISGIIMMLISVATALNVKAMSYIGFIIFLISILIIYYFIKRDIGIDAPTLALLLPVIFYALNPYFLYRFLENLGALYYPIVILTALATLYFLYESKKSNLFFIFSIGMAVACTFSFSIGLTIWFAGFIQLIMQQMQRKWEKTTIWIMSAGITFYTYFILFDVETEGLHSKSAYLSFLERTLDYPLNTFMSFMGTIGSQIVIDKQVAFVFGSIILILTIALIYINREVLQLDHYSKWYGLLAFGTLTSLMVTLGRAGDAFFFIPNVRHVLAIFLPIICLYILAIIYLKESVSQEKRKEIKNHECNIYVQTRGQKNLFLVGVIFTLLISSIVLTWIPGVALGEESFEKQTANQYYLYQYASIPDEKLINLLPSPDIVRSQALKLEQHKLSIFANPDPEPLIVRLYWLEPDKMFGSKKETLKPSYYKKNPDIKIGSETIPALFAHPQGSEGTTIIYENLYSREESYLKFSIGIDENVWNKQESDGVTFEVRIHKPITNTTQKIFSHTLNPAHSVEDRNWHHVVLPLEGTPAESFSIEFITLPNDNSVYDWAWWGDPRIVW